MPKLSFFVGIGGTGDWVMTFLKAKLQAAHGRLPDEIRMRLLDTVSSADREAAFKTEERTYQKTTIGEGVHKEKVADVGGARIYGNEYVPLVKTGTADFYDLATEIRDGQHEHLKWFRAPYYLGVVPRAQFSLTDGAGKWRQFGRMALFFFSSGEGSEVLNTLTTNLMDLNRLARDERIAVFVIGSLAGGTGAGAFLDVANIIRYCTKRIGIQLIGMLVLPGAFTRVTEINTARAYAAFRELHRFQSSFGTAEPFTVQYGKTLNTILGEKLFDAIYLLDAERDRNSLDRVRPEEGLFPSIADGIELFLDTKSGQELFQRTVNLTEEHARTVTSGTTVPAIYSSFGTWKIIFPACLYAAKFAYKIVHRYLEELVQPVVSDGTVARLQDNIRRGEETSVDHREEAIKILLDTHPFFINFVERLPDRPEFDQLEGFVRTLQPKRIVSQYLSVKDPDISRSVQDEGSKLVRDIIDGIEDGGQTGLPSNDAIRQVRNRCEGLWDKYFKEGGEFDEALRTVLRHVQDEINTALDRRLRDILRGGVSYKEKLGSLGYSRSVLGHMVNILQTIQDQVFQTILQKINEQFGAVRTAEQKVNQARSDMEATEGYDGIFLSKRPKRESHRAQRAYIETMFRWIEREQQERLLEALDSIIGGTVSRIKQWADETGSWAGYLCEGISVEVRRISGSFQECVNQIHRINDELRRIGKSYTSSIGMAVWNPAHKDEDLDTTMEGWEETLFSEMEKGAGGSPLWQQWLEGTDWDVNFEDAPGRGPVFGLSVVERRPDETQERLPITRETVHRGLYEQAFEYVFNQMQKASIIDYLAAKHDEKEITKLLFEKTAPMLKAKPDDPHRRAYLIYQNKPEHASFMDTLFNELGSQAGLGGNVERFDVYEDPYTLTFAIMQDRLEEGEIEQVKTYSKDYLEEMKKFSDEALQHRQYHVFKCEQEAVGIEKAHAERIGKYDKTYLSPLVYRLLEHPDRVEAFIDAHVFGLIGSGVDVRTGAGAWCLAYQVQTSKEGEFDVTAVVEAKTPGIVLAWTRDNRSSSLLDAISGFVLRGTCLNKPAVYIDLDQLERAIGDERVRMHHKHGDEFNRRMMERYEEWLKKVKETNWWTKEQPIGGDWEKQSLKILYTHYLDKGINHWRKLIR